MFYKQFSKIINELNPDFVESFDFWLATLPRNNQKNITASVVSARLGVQYVLAEAILNYATQEGILERYYLVKCPDCDDVLRVISKNEIAEILMYPIVCEFCGQDKDIAPEDIYMAYKIVLQPEATENEIAEAIERRLKGPENLTENFMSADSLASNKTLLYEAFYSPSESAYSEFQELKKKLDLDYGSNTTQKGQALEVLITKIFNQIKGVSCTKEVKTATNQFDCTALCSLKTSFPSIFTYLSPYFIIECKNEPNKKPDNTYCNKLLSIMDTNEAQVGIVFGRLDATKPCFEIAREHYLKHSHSRKQQIVITCCDEDLAYIIERRVDLLKYLEYKLLQVTTGSRSATFEMFCKN